MNVVKHEGQLVVEMERTDSDIHRYLDTLTQLLNRKAASLTTLQKKYAE